MSERGMKRDDGRGPFTTFRHMGMPGRVRAAVAFTATLAVASSPAAVAGPAQDPGTAAPPSGGGGTIEIDVNVATADAEDVNLTVDELVANVNEQLGTLRDAQGVLDDAELALEDARTTVSETEARIQDLVDQSDEVVVEAFVNPPGVNSVDAMVTGSVTDIAMKQTLLDLEADDDADVLEELADAREDLEVQKEDEEELAVAAEDARAEAAAEVADLEDAVGQQTAFFSAVEERLEHQAGEAVALEGVDPEVAEQLQADQDELAGKLTEIIEAREMEEALAALAEAQRQAEEEAARQAAEEEAARQAAEAQAPPDLGAPSGSLATVNCPSGGSITVDSSLSSNLSSLLDAAAADGVVMCGGGYRDPAEQIALREAHCGTSYYAVYEMPASQCSPPTARPGTSMHEQGLAIDFTCNGGGAISSQSSPCFVWMSNNASSYGLYNLPSEPWHWSTNGN